MRYALEWDDFVSWTHSYSKIEAIRLRIAETGPYFFAKDPVERAKARPMLIAIRNHPAALVGLPARVERNENQFG